MHFVLSSNQMLLWKHPWHFSGCVLSRFSHVRLCEPMDCNLPLSSVHGILHPRILELVALPSFKVSSQPRDRTHVSYVSCIGRRVLYRWRHLEAPFSSWCLSKARPTYSTYSRRKLSRYPHPWVMLHLSISYIPDLWYSTCFFYFLWYIFDFLMLFYFWLDYSGSTVLC